MVCNFDMALCSWMDVSSGMYTVCVILCLMFIGLRGAQHVFMPPGLKLKRRRTFSCLIFAGDFVNTLHHQFDISDDLDNNLTL
jgi:hypothetical protein